MTFCAKRAVRVALASEILFFISNLQINIPLPAEREAWSLVCLLTVL